MPETTTPSAAATSGLRDVVALASNITSIENGILSYRGINIDELAENASFEEVIHLLWHGKLPSRPDLEELRMRLATRAALPQGLCEVMKTLPRRTTPMEGLRTAVSALAAFDAESEDMSEAANGRKAIRIQAEMAAIVAAFDRIRNDRAPIMPRPELSLAGNFLYMLRGIVPDPLSVRALDKAFILHADHELNASTFAARVAAATLTDMHSAVVAAICALKGPLHGGANEQVMRMLNEIGHPDHVDAYIRNKLTSKEKIMGFGHAVYKDGDPRAKHLREMSRQLGKLTNQEHWYKMSVMIEELVTGAKGLKPNVDFYSASVYHYLNIAGDLFTPIFAISRTSGWVAHILEQYANNKLIRPRAEYVGPREVHYVGIEKR
ncbi:MAG TPA: citrate synthase [Phycisphaerae bacterium]|nr:citrate synthase [Phycisphaerae bacterium]